MNSTAQAPWFTLRSARITLAVSSALAVAIVMYVGRDLTFFMDEWSFVFLRHDSSWASFLDGHNGHLSLVPVAVFKLLLQITGIDHYWVYRLVLIGTHVVCTWLLFTYAARRVGPGSALIPALLLLGLGAAYDDLTWAFQIGFVASIAFSLAALLALDSNTRRGDIWAALWVTLALASASPAIPFVVVIVVDLSLRRDWKRLAKVMAVPITLYVCWRLLAGNIGSTPDLLFADGESVRVIPNYAMLMFEAALQGIVGLTDSGLGPALAVAVLAVLAFAVVRDGTSVRLRALLTGLLVFCVLIAMTRIGLSEPEAPRYIYVTAVLVLLAALELVVVRADRIDAVNPRARWVAVVVLLVAATGGIASLVKGVNRWEPYQQTTRAKFAAMDTAREVVAGEYLADPAWAPEITAAMYFKVTSELGSGAIPRDDAIARESATFRARVDKALIGHEFAGYERYRGPVRKCLPLDSGRPIQVFDGLVLRIPEGGLAELRLRRFAKTFSAYSQAELPAGDFRLKIRPDAAKRAWTAKLSGPAGMQGCVR